MYSGFFKRVADICVSLAGSVVFLPLCLVIAVLVKAEDGGSVIYKDRRIGRNGKLFDMYKFRSMKENSPDIRLADGSTYNGKDDPRVTKIGKFLRETSLDELPQLLNILKGEMSLIGPRPDPPDWLERYPEDIRIFLTVRPGITGYSQAYYRNNADAELKMKNDAFYARNYGFKMDVKIFFKTIFSVIKRDNTYKDTEQESDANNEIKRIFEEHPED